MISKTFSAILVLGVCGAGASLVFNPSLYPASIAAVGGALGGASVATELRRKQEELAIEAARVSTAFYGLYESNKGIVSPQQLSLMAGVPLEKTSVFLKALADQQKGKHIQTPNGDVYNFPHVASVLDQLTANAQAWAKDQTSPLLQENANLKAELVQLRGYVNRQQVPVQQTILNNSEEQPDPWNKLL